MFLKMYKLRNWVIVDDWHEDVYSEHLYAYSSTNDAIVCLGYIFP